MKFHGVQIQEGSSISNLTVASGTTFPNTPNEAEVFYRTDSDIRIRGLYAYIGGTWDRIASSDAVTVPSASDFPSVANVGDLFYKDSNDSNEALYVYTGTIWAPAASGSGSSATVTGDVTGTLTVGGTGALTLASIVTATTVGSASNSAIISHDVKGRITSSSSTPIAIGATQVTSGSFSDARIAQSNVTQYQSVLSIAANQTTSGTFADARIAASNVTQHQAALTIAESQITNGTLLARVADNEIVSGTWTFNNPLTVGTPSSSSHATTKAYVDAAINGLSWKTSVIVATTANITLSGTQTIDGIAVIVGQRVLVKNQSTQSQNGVYVVAAGAWVRAMDFDQVTPIDEVNSAAVFVQSGTLQADTAWTQTAPVSTINSDAMVFSQFATGGLIGGAGLTLTGNLLDVGTASTARIVVNADNIDLATVGTPVTASFVKPTTDAYGRVSATTPVVAADITALVNGTYVTKAGDTMTGVLTLDQTGDQAGGRLIIGDQTTPASIAGLYLRSTTKSNINFSAGGVLAFNAGSSGSPERMRIDATGNVGIGTTTPLARLNVDVPGTATAPTNISLAQGIRLESDLSSAGTWGLFGQSGGGGGVGMMFNRDSTYGTAISFHTNNVATAGIMSEKMRITSAGYVGIGTATPQRSLDVNGSLRLADGGVLEYGGPSANISGSSLYNYLTFNTGSTEKMRVDAGGLCVGTTGFYSSNASSETIYYPGLGTQYGLTLNTPDTSAVNSRAINFLAGGNNTGGGSPVMRGYIAQSSGGMQFSSSAGLTIDAGTIITNWTNGYERMRIDATGNVGIGSSPVSPSVKLTLSDGTVSTMVGYNYGSVSGFGTNSNHPLTFITNNAERGRFDIAGNFMVGTTTAASRVTIVGGVTDTGGEATIRLTSSAPATIPATIGTGSSGTTLQIFGGASAIAGSARGGQIDFVGGGAGGILVFRTGAGTGGTSQPEQMRIDSSGNLLVGVTSSVRKAVFGGKAVLDVVLKSTAASGSAGNSTLYFGNAATDSAGYVNYDHAGNYMNMAVNSTERLRVTDTGITVTGIVTETSTIRIKENVRPLSGALNNVLALRGVVYDLKDGTAKDQPGFIAEEVNEVLPKLVSHDEAGEISGVNYARMVAVLVEAMKEQEVRIKTLEALVAKLVD